MYRFYLVILFNIFRMPRMLFRLNKMAKHLDRYTEEEKFTEIQRTIHMIKTASLVRTKVFGKEKLPEDGGYIMYSNHQGKYDALGIFWAFKKPCSVVMDEKKSHQILTRQIMALCNGKRLKLNDPKSGMQVIFEMAEEASQGRRFLIFPEGGYKHNKNTLQEFKAGSFKASVKSKTPIVPIALVDSYRVYEGFEFGIINTEVHFLDPIPYEEYLGMSTREIADMVRGRIEAKINEVLTAREQNRKKPFYL